MKHTYAAFTVASLLLASCGGARQAAVPAEPVEIISMTPLPPVTWMSYETGMKLNVMIHVRQDGSVDEVKLLESSGVAEWDSLAVQAMKQWRYAPPQRGGAPTDVWVRQRVVVQFQEPIVMTIGQLASATRREADSLYALLEGGTDLDSLFRQSVGTFDISRYPPTVRDALRRLRQGGNTGPFRVGDSYVIFRRF